MNGATIFCDGCRQGYTITPPRMPTGPTLPDLIVTRHRGAVEWLAEEFRRTRTAPAWRGWTVWCILTADARVRGWPVGGNGSHTHYLCPLLAADQWDDFDPRSYDAQPRIPVVAEVTAADVRGRHVVGNLPLHLAALCASVTAIEFAGPPPRGAEYTAAEMTAAGARLARYVVTPA